MLGDNCPATGRVPLMRHPTNGRSFSVATGQYVDEMGAAPSPPAAPAPATACSALAPPKAAAAPSAAAAPVRDPATAIGTPATYPSLTEGLDARGSANALKAAADVLSKQLVGFTRQLAESPAPAPLWLIEAVSKSAAGLGNVHRALATLPSA